MTKIQQLLEFCKTHDTSTLSTTQIAQLLDIKTDYVSWILKKNNIPYIKFQDKITNIVKLLKDDSNYLNITNVDLAIKYNCSGITLTRALKILGFKKDKSIFQKGKKKNLKFKPPSLINEELHQIIIGSLLGDGYITPYTDNIHCNRKYKNSSLVLKHGETQREYVKFKEDLIKKHIICYYREGFRADNRPGWNGGSTSITLETIQNATFNKYRKEWYKEKKCIPNSICEINDLALAIWFQDDGSKTTAGYVLCSQGFSELENWYLCGILNAKFDLNSYVVKSKNQFQIYIPATSVENFNNIVSKYMCPIMCYKLHVRNKQEELLENPTLERQKEDNQQPSLFSNEFEGSTTNTQIQTNNVEDSNGNTSILPNRDPICDDIV